MALTSCDNCIYTKTYAGYQSRFAALLRRGSILRTKSNGSEVIGLCDASGRRRPHSSPDCKLKTTLLAFVNHMAARVSRMGPAITVANACTRRAPRWHDDGGCDSELWRSLPSRSGSSHMSLARIVHTWTRAYIAVARASAATQPAHILTAGKAGEVLLRDMDTTLPSRMRGGGADLIELCLSSSEDVWMSPMR